MKKTISFMSTKYLDSVKMSRSLHTYRTYSNAMNFFLDVLMDNRINPEETKIEELSEDTIVLLANSLKDHASTTERLYITAISGFFAFLAAENISQVNLPRLKLLIQQRSRKPGQRLPQFPISAIDSIIKSISDENFLQSTEENDRLIALRDKAFLLTLADTGLRVHEACALRRGDIDWNEGKAMIIGKGNKQAVIRFSTRSMDALLNYLQSRSSLIDGNSRIPLSAQPLFARHDRGAGKKIKPMTTTSGRNIVTDRVRQLLGEDAVGTITPHSFRHFFVTRVLRSSNNLKLAQELARHQNIAVTQRYAHLTDDELDKGYWRAIEE